MDDTLYWEKQNKKQKLIKNTRMEKKDISYIVGGNINWCNHCAEQYGGSSNI